MGDFRMPSLGADMEAGTLVEWKVKAGDAVARGDVIAVVETDKGAIDVEIWESGVVASIDVETGRKVPVGTVLAHVRTDGEAAATGAAPPARPSPPAAAPAPRAPAAPAPPAAPLPPGPAAAPRHVRASPVARRIAAERGIDLSSVRGSGPGGAITREDVEGLPSALPAAAPPPAAARAPPSAADEAAAKRDAMRRAIAAAMSRSKREIPHYYLSTDVDMSRAVAFLEAENLRRSVAERLLPAVLLLKAVARAVREVPELNGFYVDGELRVSESVHLGVAIALRGGGLVAPAIHDADRLDATSMMKALADLIARVRAGRIRSSELTDATLTVTSLGDQGVETVFGVIYPPQVALVGFGRIHEKAIATAGRVESRPVVTATLAADHRASDGARGARFLAAIAHALQDPEEA